MPWRCISEQTSAMDQIFGRVSLVATPLSSVRPSRAFDNYCINVTINVKLIATTELACVSRTLDDQVE
jgi:hypothetical protein